MRDNDNVKCKCANGEVAMRCRGVNQALAPDLYYELTKQEKKMGVSFSFKIYNEKKKEIFFNCLTVKGGSGGGSKICRIYFMEPERLIDDWVEIMVVKKKINRLIFQSKLDIGLRCRERSRI